MRVTRGRWLRAAGLALAWLVAAGTALAQDDDLPGRVGRLADVGGRVYVASGQRASDWLDASRNDTVTTGDNLWVAGDGRAELDYGGGQVRLAGDTNVHVARLDDAILALFVAHGRVIVRVRALEPGEAARVDTPNTQVALTRPGLYRIDVSPDRTRTELVVREGEATVSFATGIQQVLPGQSALLEGSEPAYADVRNGFYVDGFDTWSADRDRYYERARSANYVSRQMIGYADLDAYGSWETATEYGALWYPSGIAADWAPYRYGRWTWVGGWGWTWVDDAPWGYAPFHYGRWIYYRDRWAWAPGGWVARPVWAPAMVGWYGGSGWSLSVSYGAPVYGWVPLAWGEPFIPWWRGCSHNCWTRYNRPYAVNLAERPHSPPVRYTNWSAPGGATAVPGAAFGGRRPVREHIVDVRPQAIRGAPVLAQAPVLDKPSLVKQPALVRAPASAPLPAAAYQTRPMRLPPATAPRETSAPVGVPAGRAPVTAVPPAYVAPRPSSGPTQAAPPAVQPSRPPARAPATPGTWGATGEPATPSATHGGRAPMQSAPASAVPGGRAPVTAAPPSAVPGGRAPVTAAPPSAAPAVRPDVPRPQPAPSGGRVEPPARGQAVPHVPPLAPAPRAVVPSSPPPAVVPRAQPPVHAVPPSSPGRAVAPGVPSVAPPAPPPPASAVPPGGRAPAGPPPEGGGRGEPGGRGVPKEQQR